MDPAGQSGLLPGVFRAQFIAMMCSFHDENHVAGSPRERRMWRLDRGNSKTNYYDGTAARSVVSARALPVF
jgi:hypothetical protein